MKGKTPVRVVDLPDFETIIGNELGATLCNLFNFLISEDMERPVDVNPRKIRLNYHDCKKLMDSIQEEVDKNKELKVNLLWLNQGPAGDKDVPQGKIYLYEGYMKSSNNANNKEKVG